MLSLSSAIFVLAGVSWWRSYRVYDRFAHITHRYDGPDMTRRTWQVVTVRGAVLLNRSTERHRGAFEYLSVEERAASEALPHLRWLALPIRVAPKWHVPSRSLFNAVGFGYAAIHDEYRQGWTQSSPSLRLDPDAEWSVSTRGATVSIPHWFLCIVTVVLPTVAARRAVHGWRRSRVGLCPTCFYDLRASHGRCPECGQPIT